MENRVRHPKLMHPGKILLEEFLVPTGITQRSLANRLGWTTAKLNELIRGKRGITADSALDLVGEIGYIPGSVDESADAIRSALR